MLEIIKLTEIGERLLPYPDTENWNDVKLGPCVGVHEHCDSWIDIRQVTPKLNVLVCRSCYLRVLIPIEIETWNQLAAYMAEKFL